MKRNVIRAVAVISILASHFAAWAQLDTLGVAAITPGKSLAESIKNSGKTLSMGRVTESMDGQLLDRFNATRKFQLVAVSDLKELVKSQERAHSGNYDADDPNLPQLFKLAGVKFHVITTVDDFQDVTEKARFSDGGTGLRRNVRLSAVAKIYETATGKLLESANFQVTTNSVREDLSIASRDGELTDELFVSIARDIAGKIANHVADVVFPAKVLVKRDKQITINRGQGAGIELDQIWNVFAVGEELIDPDTNESLGREEIPVGKAKIVSIQPKTSTAHILEDLGIDRGAVLRLPAR
ncbi:MAG: hypothetical protein H0X66_10870 [Verrucomicrobia bacterium]|nr:hypothetical protein [Verrucomicrobiota bacterium]